MQGKHSSAESDCWALLQCLGLSLAGPLSLRAPRNPHVQHPC